MSAQQRSVTIRVIIAALMAGVVHVAATSGLPDLWQALWILVTMGMTGISTRIDGAAIKKNPSYLHRIEIVPR